MKLSTINQIVEAILDEGEATFKIDIEPVLNKNNPNQPTKKDFIKDWERIANEATIYLKTALICESEGIDKAMEYYTGWHGEDEFQEFRTGVTGGEE